MKKIQCVLLMLFLATVFVGGKNLNLFNEINSFKHLPQHPRILLTKVEELSLKKSIRTDTISKLLHSTIIYKCDEYLKKGCLKRELVGRRMLSVSREALQRIFYLSYAYRTTGQKNYAQRAEQELLAVSTFQDWNPTHFLDVAEMTMGVAIGYDWLYDFLSPASRMIISNAIRQKGLEPSFSEYGTPTSDLFFLTAKTNWNQVCNAGLTFGALAVFDEDHTLSEKILKRSLESIKIPMGEYAPDGAYPEGYNYWEYGTSFNVLFISAIETIFKTDFGLSKLDGFMNSAKYILNMTGTQQRSFNYADCGDGKSMMVGMFWFAQKLRDNSLLMSEIEKIKTNTDDRANNRLLPAALIWGAKSYNKDIVKPNNRIWCGQGTTPVALFRTGWNFNEDIFVGLKAGSPSVNHNHMDIGSFIMDANGVRWAIDLGMQEYYSLEKLGMNIWNSRQNADRWRVFRLNNFSHNVITFSDSLQRVDGKAIINKYGDNGKFIYAVSDVSSVNRELITSHNRGLAIVDNAYVVIRDEFVNNSHTEKARWQMATPAKVEITGDRTATLTYNNKKLFLVVDGNNVKIKIWSAQPLNDFDARNDSKILVGFETEIAPQSNTTYSVYLIPEKSINEVHFNISTLKEWGLE